MPPLKHSILKKQLDIELPDKASSHQWMERLSRLGNGVLMRALDETLTQLDLHPNHIERYDRIELDLGNIAAESFEKEFVEKLREALKAHVYLQRAKRQLEHYSNDGVGQHFPIGQSRMDLLSHFLRKGWLPWWYQASSYGSITNILQESLEKQPKMLVALLQKLQKQQQEDIIGRRLTWQFPLEQLQKLVQLLAPKADLSVLAYLQQIQKWKSKLKIKVSTQQFKQDLFRFTLDYLARKNGVVVMEQFKTYLQTTLTDTYQLSKKQQKKWLKAMERTPTAKTWTALEILTFFLENAYLPSNANLQNSQELANLYETVLETESQVFLQWLLGKQLENGKQKRRKKTRRLILQRFVNQLNWLVLLPHLVGQQLGKQLTAYYDYMLKEWSGQEWISSALQWKNSIGIFTILYFGTNKKHTTDHFAGYQISLKAHLIQTFTLPESTIGQLSKMETAFHDSKLKKQKKLEEQNTKAFQEKQERSKKQLASKAFSDAVNKVAEIGGESLKKETSELAFKQELAPHEGKKSTGKQDALKAVNGDIAIPLATNKRITPKTNWFQDTPQLSVFASLEHYLETGFFPENTAKIFQQLTFDTIFYELLTDSPEALFALLQKKTTKARKIERWAAPLRTTTLKTLVKYLQPNWFGFIETLSLALQTYLKNKKYSLSIDKTRTQTKGKVIWQLLVEVLLFQKNSTNLRELLLHVLQRLSSEIRQTEWAISTELLTWLATKGTQSRFTPLTHLLQQIEGQLSNQLKQTSSTKTDISNTQSNVLNTPSESPSTSSKSSDTQVGSSLAESGADSLKNQKTKKQGSKSLILNAKNDEFRVKDELSLLRFFLLYGYYPEKIAAGLSQQTPNDLFTKSMVNQANKLIALLTTIPEQQIVIQRLIAQIDTPQLYQLFEKIHPKQILFLKGMHDVLRLFMLKQNIEQAVLKTLLWQTVLETLLRSKKAKQVNVYWLEQTLKALSTNLQINEVKVSNDFLTYLVQSKVILFKNEAETKLKWNEIEAEVLFLLKQLLEQKIKITNNEQKKIKEIQAENEKLTTLPQTPTNVFGETEGAKSADSSQTSTNVVEETEGAKSADSFQIPTNVIEEIEGSKSADSFQTPTNVVEETEGEKSADSPQTPTNVVEETEGAKSTESPQTPTNVVEETEGVKSGFSPKTPTNVVEETEGVKSGFSPKTPTNVVEETEGEDVLELPKTSVPSEQEQQVLTTSSETPIPSDEEVEREEAIRSSEDSSGLSNDVEPARNKTEHQDIGKDLVHVEAGEFAKKDFRKVAQQLQADLFGFVVTIELAITQYLSEKKDTSTTIQEIQWQVLIPILQQTNVPLTVKDLIAQTLLGLREYLKTPIADLLFAFKQIAKTAVTQGKQRFFVLDIMLQQLDSNTLSKQGIEKDKLQKTIVQKKPTELGKESPDNQLSEKQKLETEKKLKEALQEENTLEKNPPNSTTKTAKTSPETQQETEKEGGIKRPMESNNAQVVAKEKTNKTRQEANQKGKFESIETEDTRREDSTGKAVKAQQEAEKQSDEQSEKGAKKQKQNQREIKTPIRSLEDENQALSLLESLLFFLKNAYFPKSTIETSEWQTFGDLFDKVYQESPQGLLSELQKIATKEVVNRLVNNLNEAQIQQLLNLLVPTEIVSIQSMRLLLIAIENTDNKIDTIGEAEQWQCLLAALFQSQKQLTTFELLQSWIQNISKKQNIGIVDLALVYLKQLPELISKHGQRFTPINIVLQQIVSKQTETSTPKSLEKEQEIERNEVSTFEGTKTVIWKGIEELVWIEIFLLNGVFSNTATNNQKVFTFEQAFTLALRKDASLLRTLLKKYASNQSSVKRLIANLSQASLVDLSMLLAGHRGGNMVQGLVWALQQVENMNLQIAWQTVLPYLLQGKGFEPQGFLAFSLEQLDRNTSANKGRVMAILQAFLETTTAKERIYFDQLKISLQKIIESSSTDKQELDLPKKQPSDTNPLNVILEEEEPDKDSAVTISGFPKAEENVLKTSLKIAENDTASNTESSSTENTNDVVKDNKKGRSKKDKTILDAANIPPEEGNVKKQLEQETTPKITAIALLQWFLEKGYLPDWANEILGKKNVVDLVAELLEQQSNGLKKLLLLLLPKENSRNRIVAQFPEALLWKMVQFLTSKEQTLLPVYFDLLSTYLLNQKALELQKQQQTYQMQWATFFEYLIEKNSFVKGADSQFLVGKVDSYLVVSLLQELGMQLEVSYPKIIEGLQIIAEERSQDGEEKLYPILDILKTEQRHLSLEKNFAQLKEGKETPNQMEETSQDIDVVALPILSDKETKKTDSPILSNDSKETITNKNVSQSEIEADVEQPNLKNAVAVDTLEENRKESEKKDVLNKEEEGKIEQKAVELIEELKEDKTEGKIQKRDDLVEFKQQELMNELKEKKLDITSKQADFSPETLDSPLKKARRGNESEELLEQNISDEIVSEKTAQRGSSLDKLNAALEKETESIEPEGSLEQFFSDETISEKTAQRGSSLDKLNAALEKETRPIEPEESLEQNISDETVSEKTGQADFSLEILNTSLEKATRPIEPEESLEQNFSDETVSEKVVQAESSLEALNTALEKETESIESEESLEQNISDEIVSEKTAQRGSSFEMLNTALEKATRPIEPEESLEQNFSDETVSEKVVQAESSLEALNTALEKETESIESEELLEQNISDEIVSEKTAQRGSSFEMLNTALEKETESIEPEGSLEQFFSDETISEKTGQADFSPEILNTSLEKATRSIESEESLEQNISDETVSEKTAQSESSLETLNAPLEKEIRPIEPEESLEQNISDEMVSGKVVQADFSPEILNTSLEKATRPIESKELLEQNIFDETVFEKVVQADSSLETLNAPLEKETRAIESDGSLEQNISDESISEKVVQADFSPEILNTSLEKATRPIESKELLEQNIFDETVFEKVVQADSSLETLNAPLEKETRAIESDGSLEQNISDETVSEKTAQADSSPKTSNTTLEKATRPIESKESLEQNISDESISEKVAQADFSLEALNTALEKATESIEPERSLEQIFSDEIISEKDEQQSIDAKLDAFKESDSVIDANARKEAKQITETREEITDRPLVPSLSEEGTTPVFDIFELTRYLQSNILPYDFEVFEMRFQYLVVRQPFTVKPGIIELIQKEEQALKTFIHQFSPTSFLSLLQLLQKEAATKINGYLESLNIALKPALNKRILLQYLATLGDSPFDLEEWLTLVISAMTKSSIERQKLISSTLHFLKYGQVSTKRARRELIEALRNIHSNWYPDKQQKKKTSSKKDKQSNSFVPKRKLIEDTLLINNAGLVLLHPFLTHYFNLLGYIKTIPDPSAKGKIKMRKVFKDESLAHRGVHLLSFLVNTRTDCPEHELLLNKVMCGVDIATPIPGSIEMTSKELEESERLLKVMIARWERLKNISVRYLRGSFLMRNGTLKDSSKKWTITVEKQAFDLLLKTLPWGLAFIRFPWMEKPITTKWY